MRTRWTLCHNDENLRVCSMPGGTGQTEAMSKTVTAELSSLSIAADSLRDRVGALTGNLAGANYENVVLVLYEVERALLSASRQLARAERLSKITH